MKVKIGILLYSLALAALLTACGGENTGEKYAVYYLDAETTKVVEKDVDLEQVEGDAIVDELLAALSAQPDDSTLRQTIPSSIQVLGYSTSNYQITVDFSREYYDLEPIEEVLTRAAVAKTLLQAGRYPYVAFTVESEPLVNSSGVIVGSMNADSFVENPGQQINSLQETTLTLYFASKDGNNLIRETRSVHYSSNISMEKLVMEQLKEGPKRSGCQGTIPAGTKLINVSVVDGICYISVDEIFLNQNPEITEQVVLYSIVDSMTELSSVSKVQISINGDTSGKFRYAYDLDVLYERDLSLVLEPNLKEAESKE